ncbi:hypothetical protein ALC57_04720 [Trachymyrmex cornetzi]|uniref:Uncharacterized protein n=1 Tax=Trachymyrmex cornetzi TaxID=471704 RepID=A0A195EDQ3_9HYME|nr:hypothetical protein ALC57_04720 [Trachymyrmex cornetzi]
MEPAEELMSPPHVMHIPKRNSSICTLQLGSRCCCNNRPTVRDRKNGVVDRSKHSHTFTARLSRVDGFDSVIERKVGGEAEVSTFFANPSNAMCPDPVNKKRSARASAQKCTVQGFQEDLDRATDSVINDFANQPFVIAPRRCIIKGTVTISVRNEQFQIGARGTKRERLGENRGLSQAPIGQRVRAHAQCTSPAFTNNRADTGRLEIRLPPFGTPRRIRCYFMKPSLLVKLFNEETGLCTFAKVNAQSAPRLLHGPHFGPPRFYEDAGGRAAFAHFTLEMKEFKKTRSAKFYQCKEERNFQQNCEGNSQNYVVNEKDLEKFRIFSCTYADKRFVEMSAFRKLVTENFRSRGTGFKLNLTELSSTLELP